MVRPLRLEFAGALYHVTSRGDRREDIYVDDIDSERWLEVLGEACARFNWQVHAYCQMSNHYHLLVETVDGNLSRGDFGHAFVSVTDVDTKETFITNAFPDQEAGAFPNGAKLRARVGDKRGQVYLIKPNLK